MKPHAGLGDLWHVSEGTSDVLKGLGASLGPETEYVLPELRTHTGFPGGLLHSAALRFTEERQDKLTKQYTLDRGAGGGGEWLCFPDCVPEGGQAVH